MPVISLTMGPTEKAQKKELIEKLTASAVEVTTIPAASFTVFSAWGLKPNGTKTYAKLIGVL
jgi:Tautomerase enzyme